MNSTVTDAIVLKGIAFGESDRIITLYTYEDGQVTGIAKGAKRSKRRFFNSLETLSLVRIEYKTKLEKEMAFLNSSTLIDPYTGIRDDINKTYAASYLAELIIVGTTDRQGLPLLFQYFTSALNNINTTNRLCRILRLFELKYLTILGFHPHLDSCSICGSSFLDTKFVQFNLKQGGVLCRQCTKKASSDGRLSLGTLKTLQMAQKTDTIKEDRLGFSRESLKDAGEFLIKFIRYHIKTELKTSRFIMNLND